MKLQGGGGGGAGGAQAYVVVVLTEAGCAGPVVGRPIWRWVDCDGWLLGPGPGH